MRRSRGAALLSGLLLLGGLATGCSDDGGAAAPAKVAPTRLADLAADELHLVRIAFCDLVPRAAVKAALAATAEKTASWGNGDPVPGAPTTDVAHELGCAWTAQDGSAVRAWVFARPVDATFAATLVRAAGRESGCRTAANPGFGTPTLTQTCTWPGVTRVRHAGLFDGTWLTCEVSGKQEAAALAPRAEAWCAAVATALDESGA